MHARVLQVMILSGWSLKASSGYLTSVSVPGSVQQLAQDLASLQQQVSSIAKAIAAQGKQV